jgi:hypothetical protein
MGFEPFASPKHRHNVPGHTIFRHFDAKCPASGRRKREEDGEKSGERCNFVPIYPFPFALSFFSRFRVKMP